MAAIMGFKHATFRMQGPEPTTEPTCSTRCLMNGSFFVTDDNAALREFLRARNPKQQHSAALESYLIKPIQRILKYPLLLKQLHELTDPHSNENTLLKGQEEHSENDE